MWIVKVIVWSYVTGMLGLLSPVAVLAVVRHRCKDIAGGGCAGAGGHCTMDADCNEITQMLMLVSCFCTLGSSSIAGGRAGC